MRATPWVAGACFLVWCYVSVRPHHAWEDADPEILNQAWRLARGEQIYRAIDHPPYVHTAYPPLYLALVAALLRATGLNYLPAKLISLVSALAIGWALAHLARDRRMAGSDGWLAKRFDGWWGACFLFLIPAFLYNTTRTHVQMLAVALSVWSFVFFRRKGGGARFVLSPLLAALAIYTKQTQVALPLAVCAWLLGRDRRGLAAYAGLLGAAVLIPFILLQRATGGHFWRNVVELNALSYDARDIVPIFLHHAGPIFLFAGLSALIFWRRSRAGRLEVIDYYWAAATGVTLFTLGRLGAHTQYVVEFLVVTVIFLLHTTGLEQMRGRDRLLALQLIFLFIYTPLYVLVEEGRFGMASNRAAPRIQELIRASPGPVLSQQGSFALFGAGTIHVQLGHFAALARMGRWDESALRREIEDRYFSWVITQFPLEEPITDPDARERFNPAIVEALRRNYVRADTVSPYYLYRPRNSH